MSNLSSLTSAQFKRAAEIKEQLEALTSELSALLDGGEVSVSAVVSPAATGPGRKKGKFSAEGLARLRAAQKARWARVRAEKGGAEKPAEKKSRRKMSAAGRAKIAAGARARWARVRAEKGL